MFNLASLVNPLFSAAYTLKCSGCTNLAEVDAASTVHTDRCATKYRNVDANFVPQKYDPYTLPAANVAISSSSSITGDSPIDLTFRITLSHIIIPNGRLYLVLPVYNKEYIAAGLGSSAIDIINDIYNPTVEVTAGSANSNNYPVITSTTTAADYTYHDTNLNRL